MALRTYMMDCGSYPAAEAGLEALLRDPGGDGCKQWGPRPYLEPRQLVDQFGHKFAYDYDGSKAAITFLGKDGREGGSGYNADVTEEEAFD